MVGFLPSRRHGTVSVYPQGVRDTLFTRVPRETVWKIGKVPISWSHEWAKGGGEAPFRRSVPPNMHRRDHPYLFSKQFQKVLSRKFISRNLHSPGPIALETSCKTPLCWTGAIYMLWCWIDIHLGGWPKGVVDTLPRYSKSFRACILATIVGATLRGCYYRITCI